jgi:hypothetical protein
MRFGLRAKAVEDVNDVKSKLIKTRRIIFTPDVDLKEELASTAIQITCFDRNGKEVKRVTSTDGGEVEDNDTNNTETPTGGGEQGGSTQGGTETPGDNTGGGGDDDPDDGVIS